MYTIKGHPPGLVNGLFTAIPGIPRPADHHHPAHDPGLGGRGEEQRGPSPDAPAVGGSGLVNHGQALRGPYPV